MPWYRLEYAKTEKARFLSHRELVTVLQRALRRASYPLAYSRGFNPRPRFSFGPPLGVGMAGMKECLDMELLETLEPRERIRILNDLLPSGLKAWRLELLPPSAPGLGKILDCAWYRVDLPPVPPGMEETCERLLWELEDTAGPWLYSRPKDGKVFDIAAGVLKSRVLSGNRGPGLDFLLKIGSGEIPVRGLLEVIGQRAGLPFSLLPAMVTRCGLYQRVEGYLVDPFGEVKALWEDS